MILIIIIIIIVIIVPIGDAYVAAAWLRSTDPEEETERYQTPSGVS